ncbi:MAG: DUF2271 domain-containing protein [Pseudomonadota bacterium]
MSSRSTSVRLHYALVGSIGGLAIASGASANSGTATFELPKLKVKTYHKPYTAIWIEDTKGKQIKVYRVFYDQSNIGKRWLPDLKTWWRRGGRAMTMPVSGVSRPSRGPGQYKVNLGSLSSLPAGKYSFVVEAAREKGGREIVKVPFTLSRGKAASGSAAGSSELGKVTVSIKG